jgi:predicted DCC family thiol-disulfide oxidoreductase YuxK
MSQDLSSSNKLILLYDGICNICNASVQFVLKHEKNTEIFFVSLQSELGVSLLSKFGLPNNYTDSLVFIKNSKAYTHSDAALQIAMYLKFPYSSLRMGYIIPKSLRDAVYNFIAKNRYKWFGKNESCMLPDPTIKYRFLDI